MTTLAEPEWDAETRNLALALDQIPRCPACGGDPALCQNPANEFRWRTEPPTRCHATTVLRRNQQDNTSEIPDALLWRVYMATGTAGEPIDDSAPADG